jgi:hypothetical protein
MASKPARPAPGFIPLAGVKNRAIAAAASGAARQEDQCSSHKSRYLRASAFSASGSFCVSIMTVPRAAAASFCAAK